MIKINVVPETIEEALGYIFKAVEKETDIDVNCIGGVQFLYELKQAIVWYRREVGDPEERIILFIKLKSFTHYKEDLLKDSKFKKQSYANLQDGLYRHLSTYVYKNKEVVVSLGFDTALDIIRIYFKKVDTYRYTEEELRERPATVRELERMAARGHQQGVKVL